MKRILTLLLSLTLLFSLCACGDATSTTLGTPIDQEDDAPRLTFIADFYDNNGGRWLSVEGTSFDISPNKVKEWSYDTSGSWISQWTMSSVMTVKIDDSVIQSCGSTIIFSDTSLTRYDIELLDEVVMSEGGNSAITTPSDYMSVSEYWTLDWWWRNHYDRNHNNGGSKIVVIQSQTGEPICMYMGNNVTWEVSKNLPKTTLVHIDGKALYIHRANFAIIDTSVFGG